MKQSIIRWTSKKIGKYATDALPTIREIKGGLELEMNIPQPKEYVDPTLIYGK